MSDTNVIEHLARRFGNQSRLAEAAGVKPHTICEKKRGKASLTHDQMRRLLRVAPTLGIKLSPDDFFPEFGDKAA